MASSEEIAAALTLALDLVDARARRADWPNPMPPCSRYSQAAATLRAHLSRLREEERFRDAAMEEMRLENEVLSGRHLDTNALVAALTKKRAAHRALVASPARALEEPRE